MDLRQPFQPIVRNQAVLATRLIKADRIGDLGKQIDDRRAPQGKAAAIDGQIFRRPFPQHENDVETAAHRHAGQTGNVEEQKFVGKDEVFLQQAIGLMFIRSARQNRVVEIESDGAQCLPPQRNRHTRPSSPPVGIRTRSRQLAKINS